MSGKFDPYAGPLDDRSAREASNDLIKEKAYAAVVRTGTDPAIPGQAYSLVSFNLFDPPKQTVNGHSIVGMCKVRGTYQSVDNAKFEASKIVRNIDSVHQIHIIPTGTWFPLTTDPAASQEQLKIQTSSNAQEQMMMEQAAKKMTDHRSTEHQEKLRQHKDELDKRVEEVKKEAETPEDPYSLDFYTTKRKVEINLAQQIERSEAQLFKLRSTYQNVMRTLRDIESKRPSYPDEWLPYHNKVFRERGIPEYTPAREDIARYESWKE